MPSCWPITNHLFNHYLQNPDLNNLVPLTTPTSTRLGVKGGGGGGGGGEEEGVHGHFKKT